MKDYKELISALREEAEAVKAVEWDIPICTSNHIAEAADVIEQLAQLKLVPLKYEDIVSELREETAYPPYADMLMKRAAEAVEQLVKERDNARRTLDQTLVRLNDETVRAERLEAENRAKEQYIAETIGKVIKERDAYAKCFRITRTDEPFTNHAVFKVDYKDLICHTEEEIANALVYGFARIINEHRVVQEAEHGKID